MTLFSTSRPITDPSEDSWKATELRQSEQVREAMILRHAGLVRYVLHRLALTPPSLVEFNDLVNTGILGLIDAVDRYDPQHGSTFKSYAICRIRGAILDEAKKLGWVPRTRYRKHVEIGETFSMLEREFGRPASDEEVADRLGMDLEVFYGHLSDIHNSAFLSLYDCIHTHGEDGQRNLMDVLEAPQVDPARSVELRELHKLLATAIDALPEKEKAVITLYYHQELTFKEIGHVLSVSESRACQIHTKAGVRIRGKLGDYHTQ